MASKYIRILTFSFTGMEKKKLKLNYPMPAKTYKKGISHPLL